MMSIVSSTVQHVFVMWFAQRGARCVVMCPCGPGFSSHNVSASMLLMTLGKHRIAMR